LKKINLIFSLLLGSLIFSACATTTKEGIPFTYLEDKKSREAVTFYRDYMATATITSLKYVRQGKLDEAVKLQQYILDEIIMEISSNLHNYSVEQRKIAARILDNVYDHYVRYPRSKSTWYVTLDAEKKERYRSIDMSLEDSLQKLTSQYPDGKLQSDEHVIPILIFRSYMAAVASEMIEAFYETDENEVLKDLEYVLDHLVNDVRLHARRRSEDLNDEGLKSLAVTILTKIARYREHHPRCFDKWYLALPKWERKDCEKLDNLLKVAAASHQIYSWESLLGS